MIGAERPDRRSAKLLTIDAGGGIRHLPRTALAFLFSPGDLVIANDAATLPASLQGIHCPSGEPIEVRLAAWVSIRDPTRFAAIAFGAGDHRTRTEDRMLPPSVSAGDRLTLGPLVAIVERPLGDPRLFRMRFLGDRATVLAGLARHGRPIQYAHAPEPLVLWDVCYAPSIPNPGDIQPLWIFGFPILILRDDKGMVRVFHNIGAHDGCPVVTERASGLQQLVGPYHGWTYDLKGRLAAAPYWDGRKDADLSPSALSLNAAASVRLRWRYFGS